MGHRKDKENSGSTIRRVAVLGAGVMGHSMAQVFAQHNCSVTLYDVSQDILKNALDRIRSNLRLYVEMGLKNETFVDTVLSRILTSTSLRDALQGAEFVTEAVPEDLNLKIEIFKEMDATTDDSVILASNTSSLSITEIGRSVRNAGRLIITHWFNPPHLVPIVEVVKGESTSQETFERTVQFLKAMDKEPIHVLKQVPGFLVNRIQTAMFREVIALLEDGVASPEDIDKAVRGSLGLRLAVMGPLTVVDLAGVHLWHKGAQNLYPVLDAAREPRKIWTDMVEKGFLGERTGKGFFEYPAGRAAAIIRDRDMKLIQLLNILRDTKDAAD